MKKFQFRLQTALDLRRQREEQLRIELAQMQFRKQEEEERLQSLHTLLEESMGNAAQGRVGRIDPAEALKREHYLQELEREIAAQREVLALLEQELQGKLQEVVAATQETRALEKLRERHLEAYRREELQEEQKFLDEVASVRAARVQSKAA